MVEIEFITYLINLSLLIVVVILMGKALIKATSLRRPFRSEKQRIFLKWLIISLALGVTQFSLRFIGDYQIELITQTTHHIANVLMIITGLGMLKSGYELYNMKLTFAKPVSKARKGARRIKKKIKRRPKQ
jgi:putative Mn2+ efflux pump MntP